MIYEKLLDDIKIAMKAKESEKIPFLRYINAQIQNRAMAENKEINDDLSIVVMKSELKKIEEQIELSVKNSSDPKEFELQKLIVESFLPKMMDEITTKLELEKIISEIGTQSIKDMGKVMVALKSKFGAVVNMGIASKIVKELLKGV